MDKNNTAPQEALISSFQKFLQDDALRIVEVEALNHFNSSFTYQGFTDRSLEKWPKRKVSKQTESPLQAKPSNEKVTLLNNIDALSPTFDFENGTETTIHHRLTYQKFAYYKHLNS